MQVADCQPFVRFGPVYTYLVRRAFPLVILAALAAALFLAACTEDADENGTTPSPSPTDSAIPTPVPLNLDSSVSASISTPGEQDLFRLVIDAPLVELDLDADGHFPGNRLDARLVLYEEDGTIVRVIDDGTTVNKPPRMRDPFAVLEVPNGIYFVGVEDAIGDGGPTGFDYRLAARRLTDFVRPGGDSCTDAVLVTSMNAVLSGEVLAADADLPWSSATASLGCVGSPIPGDDHVYKAVLTSGVTYQMVQTGTRDGAFYVMTGCTAGGAGAFNLAEADLVCRAGADGSDGADGVVFKPVVTGEYFLIVDGVVSQSTGTYRLHLRTIP